MINTLISLSDSISINETNTDNDLCKKKISDKVIKEKEIDKNEILLDNNNDNNNFNNIKKDEKIKIDNNKNIIKELKEITIKDNNKIKIEEPKARQKEKEKEEFSFINRPRQQRYVFDDGVFFLSDGSEFFCMDDISLRIKDYLFMKNMKSPYLKFISTFFS